MIRLLVLVSAVLLLVASGQAVATGTETKLKDTLQLMQNYKLHLADLDPEGNTALLQLIPGKDTRAVNAGESFKLYDGSTLIVEGDLQGIFAGVDGYVAVIDDLVQYDRNTGDIIMTMNRVLLLKPYPPPHGPKPRVTEDTLLLKQGYRLFLAGVDAATRTAVIQLTRANGEVVYEQIVVDDPSVVEIVQLNDGSTLIVNADFGGVIVGTTFDGIILKNLTQYNKNTGRIIYTIDRVTLIKSH